MLTSLKFLNTGEPWPPKEEDSRLRRYAECRVLYEQDEGSFPLYFRHIKDKGLEEFIKINLYRRLSTLWGELIWGEPPDIATATDGEKSDADDALDKIIARSKLYTYGNEVTIDQSRYGEGLFIVWKDEKAESYVQALPPSNWFPVVAPDNIKKIEYHVIAITYNNGTDKDPEWRLNVKIHSTGEIEEREYQLKNIIKVQDQISGHLVTQSVIGNEIMEPEVTKTGVDNPLVFYAPVSTNSESLFGQDDYADVESIISQIEERFSQNNRILDQHADPKMYGPDTLVERTSDGQTVFKAKGSKFFPVLPDDVPPGYITWDGSLEASREQIKSMVDMFYILSSTSPAAFGQLQQGLAESGSALRRLMMTPLAKVNRFRLYLDTALKDALSTALALEGYKNQVINIEWKDGLPEDDNEISTLTTGQYSTGIMSIENAVAKTQKISGQLLTDEVNRIKSENVSLNPLGFVPDPENELG